MAIEFDRVESPAIPFAQLNRLWYSLLSDRLKVACFTCDDSGNSPDHCSFAHGFAKPRMWAQYAENHEGVCLEFNLGKLVECFQSSGISTCAAADELHGTGEPRLPMLIHGPVQYGLENAIEPVVPNQHFGNDAAETVLIRFLLTHVQGLLFTKASDWSAENEYRFVILSQRSGCEFFDVAAALVGVHLGLNTALERDQDIFDRIENTKIHLYRMLWPNGIPERRPRDAVHFLRRAVMDTIDRMYLKRLSTMDRDEFVREEFGVKRIGLYMRCVHDQPFNDCYDEKAELTKWLSELRTNEA